MINITELLQFRWIAVWQRHFQVWLKQIGAALIGNFGEPTLVLLALGYGLGHFVGTIEGIPYLTFLASGMVCSSVMHTSSFEAQYSAFTRMNVQFTWQGMLATPLDVQDIVFGEIIWAASKSLVTVMAIFIVAAGIGAILTWKVMLALPVLFLAGVCFASMAMIMTALAKGYDFFLYYHALLLSPMMLLSGVFFPVSQMPELIQHFVWMLPLTHTIALTRPLLVENTLPDLSAIALHLGVILSYAIVCLSVALKLLRRRLYQ